MADSESLRDIYQYDFPGAKLRADLASIGVEPLGVAERMELLELSEVIYTPNEVEDQLDHVALQIVRDELPHMQAAAEKGERYLPPVPVFVLRGGLLPGVEICKRLSEYGIETTPALVHLSGYKDSQKIGQIYTIRDYTDDDIEMMSGRRLIFIDDGNESGGTRRAVAQHTIHRMSKPLVRKIEKEGEPERISVTREIQMPESMSFSYVWDKEVDQEPDVHPIKYLGARFPDRWGTGTGYNTAVETEYIGADGETRKINVGYFALIGGIAKQQPDSASSD